MKPQHLIGMAAALAALVAIGLLLRRPIPAPGSLSSQIRTTVFLDQGITDSGIAGITLTAFSDSEPAGGEPDGDGGKIRREVRLVRDGAGGWLVRGAFDAPANEEKIRTLLADLRGLEGDPQAERKTSHTDLGVDEAGALRLALELRDGRPIILYLGHRPAGSYDETYVRREGEDTVYRVGADLRRSAGASYGPSPAARDWLNLRLLELPTDSPPRRAILEYAGRRLTLARDAAGEDGLPGSWRLEEGGGDEAVRFQPARLEGWAAAVSLLNAEDAADPALAERADKAAETFSLSLTAEGAPDFSLKVFVEEGRNYAIASTRPGLVYTLGDSLRDRIFPPLDELFPKEEPTDQANGAEEAETDAGGRQDGGEEGPEEAPAP